MDSNGLFLTVFIGYYPVKFYLFVLDGIWMHEQYDIIASRFFIYIEDGQLIFFIEILFGNNDLCNVNYIKKIYNYA